MRFVLLIGHCSALWEELSFETSVGPGKAVYISQGLIKLSFIYLCQAPKLIFVSGKTHGV